LTPSEGARVCPKKPIARRVKRSAITCDFSVLFRRFGIRAFLTTPTDDLFRVHDIVIVGTTPNDGDSIFGMIVTMTIDIR
jgi:hypothetical protein